MVLNVFMMDAKVALHINGYLFLSSSCLRHNTFNWKVNTFCHAQDDITVELPIDIKMCQCEECNTMGSNPRPGELQGMLVFFVSQLLINQLEQLITQLTSQIPGC